MVKFCLSKVVGYFERSVIARRLLPKQSPCFKGDCPAVRDAVKRHFVASLPRNGFYSKRTHYPFKVVVAICFIRVHTESLDRIPFIPNLRFLRQPIPRPKSWKTKGALQAAAETLSTLTQNREVFSGKDILDSAFHKDYIFAFNPTVDRSENSSKTEFAGSRM
jgi:hypothetical protein